VVVLCVASESYGQFSFGVSPGIGYNSAYFGYKINNKIVPFIGFQCVSAKFKTEESGQDFDWDLNKVVSFSNSLELSGYLMVPDLGVKYFIKQTNKLQAYLSVCLTKPMLSAKNTRDGEENEEMKEILKKVHAWGGEFGFGAEYFFDPNFSIGGEFGLRCLNVKYNNTSTNSFYNPLTGNDQDYDETIDLHFNAVPTYSRISLNYYFGNKE